MLLIGGIYAKRDIHGVVNSFGLAQTVVHHTVDILDRIVFHQLVRPTNGAARDSETTLLTYFGHVVEHFLLPEAV